MVDPCPVPRVQSKLNETDVVKNTRLESAKSLHWNSNTSVHNAHVTTGLMMHSQNYIIRSSLTFSVTVKTRTVKMTVPYDQFPKTCLNDINKQLRWQNQFIRKTMSVKPGHRPVVLGCWTNTGHQRRRASRGRLPIKSSTGKVSIVTLHSYQSVCGKG